MRTSREIKRGQHAARGTDFVFSVVQLERLMFNYLAMNAEEGERTSFVESRDKHASDLIRAHSFRERRAMVRE